MCWNADISLNTFLFSLFALFFGLVNKRFSFLMGLFFLSFISMQLLEYFIWKGYDNKLFSEIGLLLVLTQPLFSIISLIKDKKVVTISLIAYILFIIGIFILYPWKLIDFSSVKAKNGHLAWNWLNFHPIVYIIWALFLLFPFIYNKQWVSLVLWLIIIGVIYLLYKKTNTWGSLFCYIANIISIRIIANIFIKNYCTI